MKTPVELRKNARRKCKFCVIDDKRTNIYVLKPKGRPEEHVCEDCFETYCEICGNKRDNIFYRHTIQEVFKTQICSSCYSKACYDIIKLDSEYGKRKCGKQEEEI